MEAVKEFLSSPFQMSALFGCAFLIGMSKTGIQGVVMLSIPIMALAFGAKKNRPASYCRCYVLRIL